MIKNEKGSRYTKSPRIAETTAKKQKLTALRGHAVSLKLESKKERGKHFPEVFFFLHIRHFGVWFSILFPSLPEWYLVYQSLFSVAVLIQRGFLKMWLKMEILLILGVSVRKKYSFLATLMVKRCSEMKYMKYI